MLIETFWRLSMSRNSRNTLCCVVLLASLLAGCVVVPNPRPGPPPPPPPQHLPPPPPPQPSVHDEIMRCRADNNRAHGEVQDMYDAARRSGRISPREADAFNAMEARLRNYRADLARDGISLQDCRRIGSAIASMRDDVARMAQSDPGLGRCMADARRAHGEVYELYDRARRTGRINPREEREFNAMEARLADLKSDLARDGISMRDCQRIHGAIARVREEVDRMADHGRRR
jgi:hypothetical protein